MSWPCSLGNGCCTFGFLISIIPERSFLYHSLYTHRKIIKAPLLHQNLSPRVFFLSLSLFLSLSFFFWLTLWSVKTRCAHSSARASKTPREGAWCLHEWCKSCVKDLLVLCIKQGISASFSLSLSYRWLRTTRFRSIKGPQQPSICRLQWIIFTCFTHFYCVICVVIEL